MTESSQPTPTGSQHTSLTLLQQMLDQQDKAAWNRFCDLYIPFIDGYLRSQGLGHHDAEDLRQEVICIAMQKLPAFNHNRRVGALRAWLKSIAENLVRNFKRKKRPGFMESDLADQLTDNNSQASRDFDSRYELDLLSKVAARLLEWEFDGRFEAQTLQIFRLSWFERKSAAEIAGLLNISKGTVASAKNRVLGALREARLDASSLDEKT